MNDSKCAAKLRAQLKRFLGELLPHFSRPKVSFLGDMIYGLMAGGDVKLSSICRAYRPRITMKKAGDRLCMHLNDKRIEEALHNFIAGKVAKRVRKDTLIIVDPSDIQKPYARQMDFLSKAWDGSKGDVGSNLGYYGCMAVACENGGRRPMPMHLRLWSPDAPGFTSENDELEKVFGIIIAATGGRGIFIYDRGGDNIEFYRYFLEKNVDFIVRLKSRYVFSWKRKVTCEELAEQCPTRYSDVITFDSHGKEVRITLHYGVVPVRLPDLKGKLLHMVVVRGLGQKPMMLLTTLAKTTTRTDLWQVVSAYITRWRVEETIRIHELPDFHFYAIADGIKMLLSRCGRWSGFGKDDVDDEPDLFKFFNCDS